MASGQGGGGGGGGDQGGGGGGADKGAGVQEDGAGAGAGAGAARAGSGSAVPVNSAGLDHGSLRGERGARATSGSHAASGGSGVISVAGAGGMGGHLGSVGAAVLDRLVPVVPVPGAMAAPTGGGLLASSLGLVVPDAMAAPTGAAAGALTAPNPWVDVYSTERVEGYLNLGEWEQLEKYLGRFIRMANTHPTRHPALLLHCRRGAVIAMLKARQYDQATDFYTHNIESLTATPFADAERLKSDADTILSSLIDMQSEPPQQPNDLADRIHDYMRFHFPTVTGHPSQGDDPLWRFALRLGGRPDGEAIFRCLLCQKVIDKGSFESELEQHLRTDCTGMTRYTWKLLDELDRSKDRSSVPKRSASGPGTSLFGSPGDMETFYADARPSKRLASGHVTQLQPVGTSASQSPDYPIVISDVVRDQQPAPLVTEAVHSPYDHVWEFMEQGSNQNLDAVQGEHDVPQPPLLPGGPEDPVLGADMAGHQAKPPRLG